MIAIRCSYLNSVMSALNVHVDETYGDAHYI